MDNGYATLRCSVKVHPGCGACKMHTMEILSSIVGAYDFTLDAERRRATIVGQVDPNFCIKAIARCNNGHAQVVWANLSHPRMRDRSYGYDYGSQPGMWREYPITSIPEYSYNDVVYDPIPRRAPLHYPLLDYSLPYPAEESMNYCSIL